MHDSANRIADYAGWKRVGHAGRVTEPDQVWRPQTRLPVLVTAVSIEDGETPPPEVGAVAVFPLLFEEMPADPADPSIVTLRAAAEPLHSGKPALQRPGDGRQWWDWTVLLRGVGWTATWYTRRPVLGQVEVTGRLIGDLSYATTGRIRGRVRRIRVASDRYRREVDQPHSPFRPVPGTRRYRQVTTSPRSFAHVARPTGPDPLVERIHEVGVLVDLDLTDVPPPPLRPSVIPAAISAHDSDLWIADRELPLVVHLDADRRVREYIVPGQIFDTPPADRTRSVWAHADGCWVGGWDGIFHCTRGGTVEAITDTPIRDGAAHAQTLLAVAVPDRGAAELILARPGQDLVRHPAEQWGDLESMTTCEDGFVLLFRRRDPSTGVLGAARLVRVDLHATVTVGAPLETAGMSYRPFLTGLPPTIVDGTFAYRVLDDLTLAQPNSLPDHVLGGGQIDDLLWIVGHPPDGSGRGRWWPLPGPAVYPADHHQYWLFTRLDPVTWEPIASIPIRSPRPDVTIDGAGTVWVTAAGVHALPRQHMNPPELLDVAELLDRSRLR